MKGFLEKLIASKKEEIEATREQVKASESADEVRSLGEHLDKLKEELNELEAKLAELDKEEPADNTPADNNEEASRSFNPLASYSQNGGNKMEERSEIVKDTRSTMEYRTAFMNYVRTGEMSTVLEKRADDQTELADLGVLIPTTVVKEIITGVKGVYGTLYSRVKKTNLKGGIKYPLGSFSATFTRVGENGAPTDRQNGGSVTGYVEFGYNIGEIRLAQTLLMSIMGVEVFESELAKVIVEAYLKAMDTEILLGDASNNEMTGILTEAKKSSGSRILAANVIEFTADEIADWTAWEKKLFANIPLSMEGANPEFVMAKQTYVGNLCTLKDSNGQPINKAGFDVTDKQHKFNEYGVLRVEKDLFKDFDSCANGEYFGMFWVPEKAYAVNENLQFALTRYFDNEKNQYVQKALVINDGKVLDPAYIYLFKKKVVTA